MPNKQPTTNSSMPDRLYGEHYPDAFLDVPRPIRTTSVATLGDYIRHLQEVDKQSDKPCFACEPAESKFDHICPNNPILTCNCADPNTCAELGNDPDGTSTSEDRCPNHDGFADNIDYTGIPIPTGPSTKGKDAVSGWPCVVVGALPEAWDSAGECVSEREHSTGDTERNTDAR